MNSVPRPSPRSLQKIWLGGFSAEKVAFAGAKADRSQRCGGFTVSKSQAPGVRAYISNQEEHHRRIGFKEEVLAMLQRHEIEYEEKYLWDNASHVGSDLGDMAARLRRRSAAVGC